MDKAMLRAMLACLLFHIQAAPALDSDTEKAIRAATFEFRVPGGEVRKKDLLGTAFAIGPNEFVTAPHFIVGAIGSRAERPMLLDSSQVRYQIADILQFSEQRDYLIFSVDRPPRVKPLSIQKNEQTAPDRHILRSDARPRVWAV
jgi:hypothetical protein